MKQIVQKCIIIIFYTIALHGNVLIYNHTPKKLTATFYYKNEPAKMQFSIEAGKDHESSIPEMKLGKRRSLKITDGESDVILGPYSEWFSSKIFYIISKDKSLKSYTKKEWDLLSDQEKGLGQEKSYVSSWMSSPFFSRQDSDVIKTNSLKEDSLKTEIPEKSAIDKWVMIKNSFDKTMYCAFYYQGTFSGVLTRASASLYQVGPSESGYALLPDQRFLAKGPRMIVYSNKREALTPIIEKKNEESLEGMIKVGFGQGSIVELISKGSILAQTITKRPLSVVLKTATPLYCAFYLPKYRGWGKSLKDIFVAKDNKKIERFRKFRGPEKMIRGHLGVFEVSADTIFVVSANMASLSSATLTRPILDTSNDIKYAICGDNEYLIVVKTDKDIFIYTLDQWEKSIPIKATHATSYKDILLKWVLRKFLNKGKK